MGIDVWLVRVGSKVNIADLPTRNQPLPFSAGKKSEYKELFKLRALVKRIGQNRFRKDDFLRGLIGAQYSLVRKERANLVALNAVFLG